MLTLALLGALVASAPPARADSVEGDAEVQVHNRNISWYAGNILEDGSEADDLTFDAEYDIKCPRDTDLVGHIETFSDDSVLEYWLETTRHAGKFGRTGTYLDAPVPLGPLTVEIICGEILDAAASTYYPLARITVDLVVHEPPPFLDMEPGQFYESAVERAVASGLTSGTSATTFSPNSPISRWQMALFLQRLARISGETAPGVTNTFADTGSLPREFGDAIGWLATTGVTKGCDGANNFCPNDPVSRTQMALFVYRFADYMGEDVNLPGFLSFIDLEGWPQDVRDAIRWMLAADITRGCSPRFFCPTEIVTRWQMVVFLDRFQQLQLAAG